MDLDEAREILAHAGAYSRETFVAAYETVRDYYAGGGDPCATSTAPGGQAVEADDEQDDFINDD